MSEGGDDCDTTAECGVEEYDRGRGRERGQINGGIQ